MQRACELEESDADILWSSIQVFYIWSLVKSLALCTYDFELVYTLLLPLRVDVWWRQDQLTDSQVIIFVWFVIQLFLTRTFVNEKEGLKVELIFYNF